jgi:glutamate formiminotransferase
MRLIAVPNVSEGRDPGRIAWLADALQRAGGRIVDAHSDEVHNRTVFTVAGETTLLVASVTALACACRSLDLTLHSGIHPRLGVLDVCPFVPHRGTMHEAIEAAEAAAREISRRCKLPVYLYGQVARRDATRELPDLRRGGLEALMERARSGLPPDLGPADIDPRFGVVCVGARAPLIAFNVWLQAPAEAARGIALRLRSSGGGPRAVRALGLELDAHTSQISMNLFDPDVTGIDDAFAFTAELAKASGVRVVATEIVGVPPERFMPDPNKEAARLLRRPGRSLENALA